MIPRTSIAYILLSLSAFSCSTGRHGPGRGAALAPVATVATVLPTAIAGAGSADGKDDVRFVAFGDAGTGSDGQRAVAAAMASKCARERCDFALMLGDNLYQDGASSVDDPQFQTKFEDVYAALSIDFYTALGNHDYGGHGRGTEFAKGQVEVDYTKKSQKWKMPSAYYHFNKPGIEFIVLDTTMQMFDRDAQQKTDVDAWFAASTATWKIALGHHPYLSNGKHGNAGSYDGLTMLPLVNGQGVKTFFDEHVCGKADLYLSAHDHSMQWLSEKCKTTQLVVSGAGAEPSALKGSNAVAYQSATRGFLYVTVAKKLLTAEFVDESSKAVFTTTMRKP
jgi:tartrate-resistant acid phosphatase type 5